MGTRRSIATLYKLSLLALLALAGVQPLSTLHAQEQEPVSIRQAESERYRVWGTRSEKEWDRLLGRHPGAGPVPAR